MVDPSPAILCRGLIKRFGSVTAVAGLDLEVQRGECFGLLGPNGAGKTTTLEILEGLNQPDAGDVQLLGEHWRGDGRALRARLGVQLQETKLPEKLSVQEILRVFRSFYESGLSERDALRIVALEEKADAQVRTLSGGQRQRLSLACALIGDPEILFLDEPTTGLDPQSRRQTWDIVHELKARGRTVLLTTHYMEEAEKLCDRVAVVDQGKIIAVGSPRELILSLGAEHVVEFAVDERAGFTVDVRVLEELPSVEHAVRDGAAWRLTVREVHLSVPALLASLAARQLEPTMLQTHHATLEDVFVSLTGRSLRDA